MSYGVAAALQTAIFQELTNHAGLTALLGGAVYDALPPGALPPLYAILGSEDVKDASDKTGGGALHEFTVTVVTESAGFASAKVAAAAISDVLTASDLALSRGTLVALNFYKAKAARIGTGDKRQIDLIFRARVSDET
ncbi:DUF3168 domain-containing protein [Yoonia sp. BS5-3]|uniref:DUF3168 domain-containing protein n=1 Tax=Yoonia phaeophyticola TaxID=3137369 RepID=A0ABZ2V2B8_9RHOB